VFGGCCSLGHYLMVLFFFIFLLPCNVVQKLLVCENGSRTLLCCGFHRMVEVILLLLLYIKTTMGGFGGIRWNWTTTSEGLLKPTPYLQICFRNMSKVWHEVTLMGLSYNYIFKPLPIYLFSSLQYSTYLTHKLFNSYPNIPVHQFNTIFLPIFTFDVNN